MLLKNLLIPFLLFSFPLPAWVDAVPGHFALNTELLYMAPSYDDTYFVLRGRGVDGLEAPTPYGKRINNPVGYNFGWRLEGIFGLCNSCCDLRLRWTHLFATSGKEVSNPNLFAELWPLYIIPGDRSLSVSEPYAGIATSKIDVMHQKGEALLQEQGWNLCGCRFLLREGVEWSYLRYHEIIDYTEASGRSERFQFHGHTKGVGPQIGVIILCEPWRNFCFWPEGFDFKFLTTGSLIAGNTKSKLKIFDVTGRENRISQNSFWRFVPEWCWSFGFNYRRCLFSHPLSVEVGYEMTTYFRGVSKLILNDVVHKGSTRNEYSDFYVHGLFFALGIVF